MDGIMTDGRRGKLWLCKKTEGHALGIVISVEADGQHVDELFLFREARSLEEIEPGATTVIFTSDLKIRGIVEGTMRDIECDCCDAKRTWWMDKKRVALLLAPLYNSLTK